MYNAIIILIRRSFSAATREPDKDSAKCQQIL